MRKKIWNEKWKKQMQGGAGWKDEMKMESQKEREFSSKLKERHTDHITGSLDNVKTGFLIWWERLKKYWRDLVNWEVKRLGQEVQGSLSAALSYIEGKITRKRWGCTERTTVIQEEVVKTEICMLWWFLVYSSSLHRHGQYLVWRLILHAPRIRDPEVQTGWWHSSLPNWDLPWLNQACWAKPWTCFGTFETFSSITCI